jgi:DNA-binding beta-propeller fold protein YncE
LALLLAVGSSAFAQGPYKVLKTVKVGGDGGFDYVYADTAGRRLYVPRTGTDPRVNVFNLDTLEPVGELAKTNARGAAVDAKSSHGFATSKPVAMWDSKTLAPIKTIDVEGGPDGLLADPFNNRIYIFSHRAPNTTVINAADGAVLGTIDLEGAPEQAATDGKGHIYVAIEDKDNVAVVDAKTMKVTAHYSLDGKGGTCAGLALDAKNSVLFVACRQPAVMVMMSATDGKILSTLPIGTGVDGAAFNPATMEAFSSQGDGTLTVIKENSPTSFEVEQTVKTMPGAKTMTLDTKTGQVYLIAAEYGPPPAPAPAPAAPPAGGAAPGGRGRGPGRGPMLPGSFSVIVVGK